MSGATSTSGTMRNGTRSDVVRMRECEQPAQDSEHSDRAEAGSFPEAVRAEHDERDENSAKVSDISSCSYTQKFGYTAEIAAAMSPTRRPDDLAAGVAHRDHGPGAHERGEQLRREPRVDPDDVGEREQERPRRRVIRVRNHLAGPHVRVRLEESLAPRERPREPEVELAVGDGKRVPLGDDPRDAQREARQRDGEQPPRERVPASFPLQRHRLRFYEYAARVTSRSAADAGDSQRFFFVHIMKTGGTSLVFHLLANFAPDEVYPGERDKRAPDDVEPYASIADVLALSPERREEVRFYSGHFPYFVRDLLGVDVATLTLLRDPVDRTISVLRHFKRLWSRFRDSSLDEIYDDEFVFRHYIENFQTRVFALTRDDAAQSFASARGYREIRDALADPAPLPRPSQDDTIRIDDRRLAIAQANVAARRRRRCQRAIPPLRRAVARPVRLVALGARPRRPGQREHRRLGRSALPAAPDCAR